jgi:hypothetical protein
MKFSALNAEINIVSLGIILFLLSLTNYPKGVDIFWAQSNISLRRV